MSGKVSLLWVVGVILTIFCFLLAYIPAMQSPLFFDDIPNLVQNPPLHIDGLSFDAWRTAAFSSDAGPLRRPITMLSFAANYVVFNGFSPLSLKLVNLAIHLLNAIWVYLLAFNIFRSPVLARKELTVVQLAAFAASAIWLLHPLHVSTVAFSVQRMAQLSAFFTLFGLWLFTWYRLRWAEKGASFASVLGGILWLCLISVLAVYSKENGALLPWLIVIVEVTLFRGRWAGQQNRFLLRLGWAFFILPLLLIALILLLSPEIFTAGYQQRDFTLTERLMTQSRVLWHYLGWIVLPDVRAMGFQHDDIALSRSLFQPLTTLIACFAWALALVLVFIVRHRFPLLLFALLFFMVAQVMESSVLALEMVYEHRNYLPSVGVCILLAGVVTAPGIWRVKLPGGVVVGTVLAILFVLLFIRGQTWSGQMSLAQTNVINHPASTNAHFFYAEALLIQYSELQGVNSLPPATAEKTKTLILDTRKHLLLAHKLSPTDTAVLVMLLYVDGYFFPGVPQQPGWLTLLDQSLEYRVLQASDYSALSLLVECSTSGACDVSTSRLGKLLDGLIARQPNEVHLLLTKYEYLLATAAPQSERMLLLEHAATIAPGHPSIESYRIMEENQLGNVAGMYEVVRNWLANDARRWQLPLIKPLFSLSRQALPQQKLPYDE